MSSGDENIITIPIQSTAKDMAKYNSRMRIWWNENAARNTVRGDYRCVWVVGLDYFHHHHGEEE